MIPRTLNDRGWSRAGRACYTGREGINTTQSREGMLLYNTGREGISTTQSRKGISTTQSREGREGGDKHNTEQGGHAIQGGEKHNTGTQHKDRD